MLNNFRNLQSLFFSHGARWLTFRLGYALRRRTGLLRRQMPAYRWQDRPLESWLKEGIPSAPEAYVRWRRQNAPKFFFDPFRGEQGDHAVRALFADGPPRDPSLAVDEADRVLRGEIKYFAHRFVQAGFPPDWHRDPLSGARLDSQRHWSEMSDDPGLDIKLVWEASRFGMVYPLVRAFASTRDERYAEAFWALTESWAESNPPNTGPNWMDGQEAALRLMAWTFGYHTFLEAPSTTPERIARFTVLVAAHAERIYRNIGYAISTHSNHTVSEAFGLWLAGLIFPELSEAERYRELGRRLLEQEAAAQIFPDGAYSMYSVNYHRFVLHLYLSAIRLAELNQAPFSTLLLDRVSASIHYLSQLIDPQTGRMPLYGSNDGALVLPLNNCDFTDYRPLLQLGSYITRMQLLSGPGPWNEDIFWLCGKPSLSPVPPSAAKSAVTETAFAYGGMYLLHGASSKAVIRCTDWPDADARPSHADQLHVDLWIRGRNIAPDAGTYVYSGEGVWRNGLAHTAVHNTVTVDRRDQMKMLTRFTWTDRARGTVLRHDETTWQGEHDGYRRLPDPVKHRRAVLSLGEDRWLIVDHLRGKQPHHYALHWLLDDLPYEPAGSSVLLTLDPAPYKIQLGPLDGESAFSIVRADPGSTRGWRSRYYGDKEPALSLLLETDRAAACFWSFFGFQGDRVEARNDELKIAFDGAEMSVSLSALAS